MEFRKMVTITLHTRQQKGHWCIEQSYGLWERERVGRFGRMALKHVYYHVWNKSPVQVWCTILDAWGWCTGTTQRDGIGREEGSGWGTHVYLWRIHFDIWQNQYNVVKFKNKIKLKNKVGLRWESWALNTCDVVLKYVGFGDGGPGLNPASVTH